MNFLLYLSGELSILNGINLVRNRAPFWRSAVFHRALAVLTVLTFLVPSAFAGIWSFNVESFVDDPCPLDVQVTVNDEVNTGFVTIYVDVTSSPIIGDIRGVWLHLGGRPDGMTLDDITGDDVTAKAFDTINMGGGNNLNPSPLPPPGLFDIGTEIGTSGKSTDDIQHTVIKVARVGGIAGDDFIGFGVRVTSVGDPAQGREGSCKLFAGEVPDPAPEPGTLFLLGAGLAGAVLRRRRRRA